MKFWNFFSPSGKIPAMALELFELLNFLNFYHVRSKMKCKGKKFKKFKSSKSSKKVPGFFFEGEKKIEKLKKKFLDFFQGRKVQKVQKRFLDFTDVAKKFKKFKGHFFAGSLKHIEPYVYLQHVLGWQAKKTHRDSQTKVATTIVFLGLLTLQMQYTNQKKQ